MAQEPTVKHVESNINYRPTKHLHGTFGDNIGYAIRKFFDSTQILVLALGFLVLVYLFVASFSIVDGPSMESNFFTGDITIYEKITTTFGKLQRGDVIVFQSSTGKDFIKRIIGLPRDTVKIEGGRVYVNGKAITEGYLSPENKYVQAGSVLQEGLEITIPDGQYIVLGDNRRVSYDSRNMGPIEMNKIKGKVWTVFWPFERIGFVNHVRYPELGDK